MLIAALLLAPPAIVADADRLRGDPQAVERIERMLEQFGGARAWADARTLYLEYRGWRTDPDEPLIEKAWRDLREANQRIELVSASAPVTWAFTPQAGWVERKAGIVDISAERLGSAIKGWPYDFYTIIRTFAAPDGSFTLEFFEPRRVVVRSATGAEWGWWEIDSGGNLLKWGSTVDDDTVEYVYGPPRQFGSIRFPAWGASVDGSWRFEYAEVQLSPDPIPAELLTRPE